MATPLPVVRTSIGLSSSFEKPAKDWDVKLREGGYVMERGVVLGVKIS